MTGPFPFPRSERLIASREIRTVLDSGRSGHGSFVVLFVHQNPELPRQVAFVASRRVGNAVHRNRSKRLMREAYRHLRGRLPETGVHMVLVARKACAQSTFQNVTADMERVAVQMGLL